MNLPSIVQTFKENHDKYFSGNKWQEWTEDDNPITNLLNFIKKSVFINYINSLLRINLFEYSQLIVLPHHGTNTENSQRYLGYFSGIPGKRAFIVSSSPFGPDNLPKRSTLEMAPVTPIHPEHPFSYGHDNSKNINSKNISKRMQITRKPIYVTGMAPGGVYCFKISERAEDMSIYMLNLYGESPFWFNVLDDYCELGEL